MKKKEVYEELKKELRSHSQNISWIMRSADDTSDLKKINIFLPNRLVEINKLLEILDKGDDISKKSLQDFANELTEKTIFK